MKSRVVPVSALELVHEKVWLASVADSLTTPFTRSSYSVISDACDGPPIVRVQVPGPSANAMGTIISGTRDGMLKFSVAVTTACVAVTVSDEVTAQDPLVGFAQISVVGDGSPLSTVIPLAVKENVTSAFPPIVTVEATPSLESPGKPLPTSSLPSSSEKSTGWREHAAATVVVAVAVTEHPVIVSLRVVVQL